MFLKTDYLKIHRGDYSYLSFSSDRLSAHCSLHCHYAIRSLAKQNLEAEKIDCSQRHFEATA